MNSVALKILTEELGVSPEHAQQFLKAAGVELKELGHQFRRARNTEDLSGGDRKALHDLLAASRKMSRALNSLSWEARELVEHCLPAPVPSTSIGNVSLNMASTAACEFLRNPEIMGPAVEGALGYFKATTDEYKRHHGKPIGRGLSATHAAKRATDSKIVAVICRHYQEITGRRPSRKSGGPFVRLVKVIYEDLTGARIDPRPLIGVS